MLYAFQQVLLGEETDCPLCFAAQGTDKVLNPWGGFGLCRPWGTVSWVHAVSLCWLSSERSSHLRRMEWEIWAVVQSYWGHVGIAQNISRQMCMHTCAAALHHCGRKYLSASGKSLNVQKVNLALCITSVVLGTAAQKSWLCCWKLPQRVTYREKEILSFTKGLVNKETKKK